MPLASQRGGKRKVCTFYAFRPAPERAGRAGLALETDLAERKNLPEYVGVTTLELIGFNAR